MNLELVDKTALISGSTKGIGFAVASQLAAEGARVIVNGRSDNAVNSALKQIHSVCHLQMPHVGLLPSARTITGKLRGKGRGLLSQRHNFSNRAGLVAVYLTVC